MQIYNLDYFEKVTEAEYILGGVNYFLLPDFTLSSTDFFEISTGLSIPVSFSIDSIVEPLVGFASASSGDIQQVSFSSRSSSSVA